MSRKQPELSLIDGIIRGTEISDELACGCHTHSVYGFVIQAGCEIHD